MTPQEYPHTPGSPQAVKDGCVCPQEDNWNGKGAYFDNDSNPVFWYDKRCPLHGQADDVEPETMLYPMTCIVAAIVALIGFTWLELSTKVVAQCVDLIRV